MKSVQQFMCFFVNRQIVMKCGENGENSLRAAASLLCRVGTSLRAGMLTRDQVQSWAPGFLTF